MLAPSADVASDDRHALALALHGEGRAAEGMQMLVAEAGDRLHDADLLNDLGVLAFEAGRPQTAEAVLRTATLLAPDAAVRANLDALDALRGDGFCSRLIQRLVVAALGPDLPDNYDPLHNPDGPPGPLHSLGVNVAEIMREAPDLEWLYRVLADDASRELMVDLFAFRVLGAAKVALPIGARRNRELIGQAKALRVEEASVALGFLGWHADRYDLAALDFPVVIDAHTLNIVETFLLQQYACPEQPAARARPGDVAIDGGGCWGDTALYLAAQVGATGRVVTYEFSPSNLELLHANLARNPELESRIDVEYRALWHSSDERLAIEGSGPATHLGDAQGSGGVLTRALDDTADALGLDRIDFIKLDIEGAELQALKGAEQTLRRHRPRLAIALYHDARDWVDIPTYLDGLGLGYRFSLGHFTVHHGETVLFAWCDDGER
jgi:FkbM family methyltransferase